MEDKTKVAEKEEEAVENNVVDIYTGESLDLDDLEDNGIEQILKECIYKNRKQKWKSIAVVYSTKSYPQSDDIAMSWLARSSATLSYMLEIGRKIFWKNH